MTSTLIPPTDATNFTFLYENAPKLLSTPIYLPNDQTETTKNVYFEDKGHYIDEENEYGLSDLKVVLLASLATLIPLLIILVTVCGIRIVWIKFKRRKEVAKYDGMLGREMTNDSSKPLHSHLLSSDKISLDTQLEIIPEPIEICDNVAVNSSQTRSNHSSTNGSIITMTLKNNHLIVETEERNDIEENCRETTMRYSPSARDGIFVVEVQQGVKRSPSNPQNYSKQKSPSYSSDQCALVHNSADSEKEDRNPRDLTSTGLSQSNSSLFTYNYTNQQCYDNEGFGYPIYKGYVNNEPLKKLSDSRKPKITSAVYKNLGSVDLDAQSDFLLSDIAARDKIMSNLEQVSEVENKSEINKNISQPADCLTETEIKSSSCENNGVNLNGLIE